MQRPRGHACPSHVRLGGRGWPSEDQDVGRRARSGAPRGSFIRSLETHVHVRPVEPPQTAAARCRAVRLA